MVPFPMGYVPGSVCIWSLCFDCDSLGLVSSFDCNQAVVPLACLFLCVCLPWVCLCVCVCVCALGLCVCLGFVGLCVPWVCVFVCHAFVCVFCGITFSPSFSFNLFFVLELNQCSLALISSLFVFSRYLIRFHLCDLIEYDFHYYF